MQRLEPWHGHCRLQFTTNDGGRTRHQGGCRAPFKLLRAEAGDDGRCELPLLHTAGGLVGGDQLSIDLGPVMSEYRTVGARRVANCENADPPFRSVRGQDFFVLQYALSHAAASGALTEAEILDKLSDQGITAVKSMPLPIAVRMLLQETAYRPE